MKLRHWLAASFFLACGTGSEGGGSLQTIHPQPQPNSEGVSFIAPCTASSCGPAPASLASPRCKAEANACAWSDDTSVSYRSCADSECGTAPDPSVCPSGTTFRGNACGSENEAACAWRTTCAPPRSTVPCSDPEGCGGKPELGVICSDGSTGDLACMTVNARCAWQRTCD